MNIKEKALNYAIKAHKNQVRKAEKEKPAIIHSMGVGKLLEEYGFDDNVVAAGYLHDVVEDTEITIEEIYQEFGEDIGFLVSGATEQDRTLPWEERKLATINRIKLLPFRAKAVVLADKIKNTENLINLFERKGSRDYSSFNRGKEKKVWYWQESYKSLTYQEDENHPMFKRLKKNIELIAEEKSEEISENLFNQDINNNPHLKKIYYKTKEIIELKDIQPTTHTYIICIQGTNNQLTKNIADYLKKFNFNILYQDISWSKEELQLLTKNSSELEKIIKTKQESIINIINTPVEIVLLNSNLHQELQKIDSNKEQLSKKTLKLLKNYLTTLNKLINHSIIISKNSSNLVETIIDNYKETQLSQIKKLIKKQGEV